MEQKYIYLYGLKLIKNVLLCIKFMMKNMCNKILPFNLLPFFPILLFCTRPRRLFFRILFFFIFFLFFFKFRNYFMVLVLLDWKLSISKLYINLSSLLFFYSDFGESVFGVLTEEGMSVKWWYKKKYIKAINKVKKYKKKSA